MTLALHHCASRKHIRLQIWLTRKAATCMSEVTLSLCSFLERTLICSVTLPARHSLAEFRLVVYSTKAHTLPVAMRDFAVVYSDGTIVPRGEEARIAVASLVSLLSDSATLVIYARSSVASPPAHLLSSPAEKSPTTQLLNDSSQRADLAPCCYFKALGKCRFSSCNFSHDVLKPGCNKGVECKRGHSIGAKTTAAAPCFLSLIPTPAAGASASTPTSPVAALKSPIADDHSPPSIHRPLRSKLFQK